QAALSAKWLLGKNRLIRDVSIAAQTGKHAVRFDETVDRMLAAITQYDLVAIDDGLLELFAHSAPASKSEAYDLIVRIISRLHAGFASRKQDLYKLLAWESHQPVQLFQFETIHDIVSWLRKRRFELSERLYTRLHRPNRKLISQIMRYV